MTPIYIMVMLDGRGTTVLMIKPPNADIIRTPVYHMHHPKCTGDFPVVSPDGV